MALQSTNINFLLPVKDLIMFPEAVTSILIGRPKSVSAIEEAYAKGLPVFVISEKGTKNTEVTKDNIYKVGVLCRILQKSDIQNGQKRIVVEGLSRAEVINIVEDEKFYLAETRAIKEKEYTKEEANEISNLKSILMTKMKEFLENTGKPSADLILSIDIFRTINEIVFYSLALVPMTLEKKQEILEEKDDITKLKNFIKYLETELSLFKIDKKINNQVEKKFLKQQKKIYFNEKIKIMKKELGDDFDEDSGDSKEIKELKSKIKKQSLSTEAKKKCLEEVKKLEGMMSYSSEYNVIRNFVDLIISLPWNIRSKNKNTIEDAEKILNRDHYALKEVKDRILEYIAVYQRKQKVSGSIICLVGPPGVGKTSLVKSIAEALSRKYVKVSLGGMRDEAEIRGHRRTYIGAMPGKIIQSIKKAETSNPVMLLDEIDKMNSDFRGDPASALLEVLDPEQNKKFSDHYLEIDYDLSDVMFIATANNIAGIPIPLRDRMEIIRISGYTEDEKLNIAKEYLIKKELEQHGLTDKEFSIDDKSILEIIRNYTFEAGVRNLDRELAKTIRKSVKKIVMDKKIKNIKITTKNIKDYLGVEKFNYNKADKEDKIGVSTGLAYTDFGGDLLYIESLRFSGTGKLVTTGKLGDVMKESAQAAFSYVRSVACKFDISAKEFNKCDFHLHVPEGATPKDGPSAGVAIVSSLLSSMTGLKIHSDVAMTGEISLTGRVMPIGGLKEKLLAALRGGIKTVVIPYENIKNLEEIPDNVKKGLKIAPVKTLDEALKIIVKGYK